MVLNSLKKYKPQFILPVEWKIAFRYLIPKRNRKFTSIISLISFLGILIGVWALIVVMSVMNGFRVELMDRILGLNGHIIAQSINGFDSQYPSYVDRIRSVKGVKLAFPVIEGQVLFQGGVDHKSSGVVVRGLEQIDLEHLPAITSHIVSGNLSTFSSKNTLVIGLGLAQRLGLMVGDSVKLLSPNGDITPFGTSPRMKSYQISAIYKMGMSEFDSMFIFMPMKEAQLFFNLENKVQSLQVFLNNADDVDFILPILQNNLKGNVFLTDWRQQNQTFFSALQVERNVMFIILFLIILVAALNIVSGLVMLVKDKVQDIAILRTMGAQKNSILRIFMIVGLCIGVTGTCLGVILAILTCTNINRIQNFVSWFFGVDVFNPNLYFLSKLPAQISATQILFVVLMTLSLSFFATLFPAWYAAKLDPVQALRYE